MAEGRDMTEEEVEEVARGRVWSGTRALEVGLVDELGGLEEALAAEEAGGNRTTAVKAIQARINELKGE